MTVKEVENKIRDLINELRVMQQEEDEQGCQSLSDSASEQIVSKLEELARAVGELSDAAEGRRARRSKIK